MCSLLFAIHGVKLYAHTYTRGKVYAQCFIWIEALCSFLLMNSSHGVKLFANYYI